MRHVVEPIPVHLTFDGYGDVEFCWVAFLHNSRENNRSIHKYTSELFDHYHHHVSLNREGRWGTTDDFATILLHFPMFTTALWDLPNSRLIHSLTLFDSEQRNQCWGPWIHRYDKNIIIGSKVDKLEKKNASFTFECTFVPPDSDKVGKRKACNSLALLTVQMSNLSTQCCHKSNVKVFAWEGK